MKISYQPTFNQFADNYLSTYYSGGVRVVQRIAGGPLLIVLGGVGMILINERVDFWLLRWPLLALGLVVAVYGLWLTLRPLVNLMLVWLRREQLFEGKGNLTTLELKGEKLHVRQGKDSFDLPLDDILVVQHRSANTWIITKGDALIYFPREGLVSGEHDKFDQALQTALTPEDEEE